MARHTGVEELESISGELDSSLCRVVLWWTFRTTLAPLGCARSTELKI